MTLLTVWFWPYCLVQGDFLTLFFVFTLAELLELLKTLAQLGLIGVYYMPLT